VATFQLYWWRNTSGAFPRIISDMNGHMSRATVFRKKARKLLHMKKSKVLSALEPTTVSWGELLEVNDLNYSETQAPRNFLFKNQLKMF
jgi:hypothetical protein